MTEDRKSPAEGQSPEPEPKKSKTNLPPSAARRISKTMIEGSVDLEQLTVAGEPPRVVKTLIDKTVNLNKVVAAAQPSQPSTSNRPRKMAKTLIDESIRADQVLAAVDNEPAKAAKTLMDSDVCADNAAALQPNLPAETVAKSAVPPEKGVAKTILEKKVPDNVPSQGPRSSLNGKPLGPVEQAIPAAVEKLIRDQALAGKGSPEPSRPTSVGSRLPRGSSRDLVKTLHEFSFKATEGTNHPSLIVSPDLKSASEPSEKGAGKATRQYMMVARTMLDHDVLYKEVNKSSLKKEAKIAEQNAAVLVRSAPQEQRTPVDRIKGDKLASTCPWRWAGDAQEKFRSCGQCQTTVYNLADMSRAEAEELIFVRENRKKFTLFERADGKFMTVDCPIESQRRQKMRTLAAVGIICLLLIIAAFVLMPPPAPKPVTTLTPIDSAKNSAQPTKLPVGVRRADGSFHWQAGETVAPTSQQPASQVAQPVTKVTTPDPDENGEFWQYANPQSAGINSNIDGSH